MVNEGCRQIQVICEDTDVFVILLHHYHQQQLSEKVPPVDVLMQYPPSAQTVISIPKTIETVVSSVLAAHVLSGCDTVPLHLWSVWKKWQQNAGRDALLKVGGEEYIQHYDISERS